MPRVSSLLAPGFYIWRHRQWMLLLLALVVLSMFIALAIGKAYQHWDDDPNRGAVGLENGAFGESYATPIYLDQGWSAADSLWFYTTTQGSNLLPYDFFMVLEQAGSDASFRSDANIDLFRYLPQKPTFFNPDGMPVGFAKDTYEGRDYIGFTCAACHTGQINYRGMAIRIDGGPAMADMVGFLTALEQAMKATLAQPDKWQRFVGRVIELDNDFRAEAEILDSLRVWTQRIELYNTVNHSHVDYGYARLDAFGRIYNRVLQHILNRSQLAETLALVVGPQGNSLLSDAQIQRVLQGLNTSIISEEQFALVVARLQSAEEGMPGLGRRDMLRIRDALFNEPNAPVSYPFLWDIVQSDYVQWNGLANNAGVGPLGRNTGEVIGVFGNLDWSAHKPGFNLSSLSAWITGQSRKHEQINFKSSIDLVNLERLEAHLKSLTSPAWPESIFGSIDLEKARQGRLIYAQYCESCHEVIQPRNWDRVVIGKIMALDKIGTDPAMAQNSVQYTGKSGNFNQTVQETDVGKLYIAEEAPVVQILTSATRGVVATPDADKWLVRRWLDWLYTLGMSFFQNEIQATIKSGNYTPDTTAQPYNSLLAYKARPLNGIWATAPYLHNGSVPTLYDLLLPKKRVCSVETEHCIPDPETGHYRPDEFYVGQREFDPVKVGHLSQATDAKRFITTRVGDLNSGHEYGAGRTPQLDGKTILPALDEQQRWQLIEYLKTL